MADVLAYAEQRGGSLRNVAREAVSAAAGLAEGLGGTVHAVVLGPDGIGEASAGLGVHGAAKVWAAEGEAFDGYRPDAAVRAVLGLAERGDYGAIVFPASAQGKDLAPRVAARLDRGLATEVTALSVEDGAVVARRPVYAGKAIARIRFPERPALVSIRPNVFPVRELDGDGEVEALEVDAEPTRTRVGALELGERERPDVAEAPIIVSGGRGMQGPEEWALLEDLADALGDRAALGASRAVVDAGWRPHSEQVGQTGKTVAPQLYFAIGISGAIQHQAGMRTAKTIVAINKDPEAPIFKLADYGVVGDLFEVVPRLTEEIRKARAGG